MSKFTEGFEKQAGLWGTMRGAFQNVKSSVKSRASIPVPRQSPPGMRINVAPKVTQTSAASAPSGPFEKLRQIANSPMNKAKMYAGGALVGTTGAAYGGVKAMDWATGNEPSRPDW